MRTSTVAALLGAVGLCATLGAGCARFEPQADANPYLNEPVSIIFAGKTTERLVLAELYKQKLESEGRAALVAPLEATSITQAAAQELNFNASPSLYLGCTGAMLNFFDPTAAREISREYVADKDNPSGEDFLERTHVALMNSLPTTLAVVEPASAEGCTGADPQLPENYVVAYRKGLFDREEKLAVASLTKFLTRQELDKIIKRAEKTSVPEAVAVFMAESNGGAGLKTGGDSNSSNSDLSSDGS